MAGHTPVEDDPEQLKHAEYLWHSFMTSSKYMIAGIVVVMLILLFAFVPFGS